MIRLLIAAGFLLIGTALIPFFCTPEAVAPEILGITKTEIRSLTEKEISLRITAAVRNTNPFSVTVTNARFALCYEDDTIGVAASPDSLILTSRGDGSMRMDVRLQTAKAVRMLASKKDTVRVRLKGTATAAVSIVTLPVAVDLPFAFSIKDNILKTLQDEAEKERLVTIRSASVTNIGLSEAEAVVTFTIRNPFNVGMTLERYPAVISVSGNDAGAGDLDSPITIPGRSDTTSGAFRFQMNFVNSVSSLFSAVLSRELQYQTSGVLHITVLGYAVKVPYTIKGSLLKI